MTTFYSLYFPSLRSITLEFCIFFSWILYLFVNNYLMSLFYGTSLACDTKWNAWSKFIRYPFFFLVKFFFSKISPNYDYHFYHLLYRVKSICCEKKYLNINLINLMNIIPNPINWIAREIFSRNVKIAWAMEHSIYDKLMQKWYQF